MSNASGRLVRLAGIICILIGTLVPWFAGAEDLIPPRVTDRKFPQGVFCPIPLDLAFVANSSTATIRFSTQVFYFNDNNQDIEWTEQSLDNICVAPDAVYQANLGNPGTYSSDCYIGQPVPKRFYFQNAGSIPLKELFDTEPGARGWDLAHGAYWRPSESAPNDPGTETNLTLPPGALGLGQNSATPSLTDSAFTSFTVTGLTQGQTYDLSGWWDVKNMQLDKIFLTVRITGQGTTPIVRRTWGGLKRSYR